MESLIGILPVLAFLACPLMMVFCFWSMRRMGCETDTAPAIVEPAAATVVQDLPLAERVTALQNRLDQLQTEQDVIGAQLAELAQTEVAEDSPDGVQDERNSSTSDAAALTAPFN